jgi:colanic acid/amylovoran biosynthesis protein
MFYHGGSKNRGCEAIVRSSIPIIKEALPHATINLASFDPDSDVGITGLGAIINAKRISLKKYSLSWLIGAFQAKFFKNDNYVHRKQNARLLEQIQHHDVFLSIGGDNYCYGEQPWLYEFDRLIKKAGKKLVLWGASIGAEDLSSEKIKDLKQFDLLLIRESLSHDVLVSAGIKNVVRCADSAFTMGKEELPLPEGWRNNNTIGFNYSPLIFKRNKDSKVAAFALIQHILETTDAAIALIPHVIIPNNDDYEVLTQFYEQFRATGRVFLIPNNLNALQYKGYISRLRLFIGARTHATIAAYSNLVPTMVLGYSVKSKGIAKDIFGVERLVVSIAEVSNSNNLIEKFEELKRDEDDLRAILATNIPALQQMAKSAGTYLKEVVQK